MSFHNETCGCADCGNYGQTYNPHAIHNQSCGCAECGNYPHVRSVPRIASEPAPSESPEVPPTTAKPAVNKRRAGVQEGVQKPTPGYEMIKVPIELLDEVRALIAKWKA